MRIFPILVVLTVILVFSECWTPNIKWRNPSDPKAKKKNDDFLGLEDIYAKQTHHKPEPKVAKKYKSSVTDKPTAGTSKEGEALAAANKQTSPTEKQKHVDALRQQLIELHKKINSLKGKQRRDVSPPNSKEEQETISDVQDKEKIFHEIPLSSEEQEKEDKQVNRLQEKVKEFQNKLSTLQEQNLAKTSVPNTESNQNEKQTTQEKENILDDTDKKTVSLDDQIINLEVELEEMLLELATLNKKFSEENRLPKSENNQNTKTDLQDEISSFNEKQELVLDLGQEVKQMQKEIAAIKSRKRREVNIYSKKEKRNEKPNIRNKKTYYGIDNINSKKAKESSEQAIRDSKNVPSHNKYSPNSKFLDKHNKAFTHTQATGYPETHPKNKKLPHSSKISKTAKLLPEKQTQRKKLAKELKEIEEILSSAKPRQKRKTHIPNKTNNRLNLTRLSCFPKQVTGKETTYQCHTKASPAVITVTIPSVSYRQAQLQCKPESTNNLICTFQRQFGKGKRKLHLTLPASYQKDIQCNYTDDHPKRNKEDKHIEQQTSRSIITDFLDCKKINREKLQ